MKDLSTPVRDLFTPVRDLSTLAKDLSTPAKDLSTFAKDLSTLVEETSIFTRISGLRPGPLGGFIDTCEGDIDIYDGFRAPEPGTSIITMVSGLSPRPPITKEHQNPDPGLPDICRFIYKDKFVQGASADSRF